MGGFSIGSGGLGAGKDINTLNFQSGTLQNVNQINNGAGLTKITGGTLILAGSNSYTGATNIQAGTLLNGSATAVPSTTTITLGSTGNSAVYDLGGNSSTIAGLLTAGTAASQTVTNSGTSNATLTVANSSANTFGGVISDGSTNTTSLIKAGTSTLTLTGGNTYSGPTAINLGTLLASNTTGSATGSGAVTVGNGTNAAVLGGGGTIAGPASVSQNATISPSAGGSPRVLKVGGLTFAAPSSGTSTSTYQVAITGPGDTTPLAGAGTNYDSINNTGAAALLNGANLVLLDGTVTASGTYDILQNARDTGSTTADSFSYNGTLLTNGSLFFGGAKPIPDSLQF